MIQSQDECYFRQWQAVFKDLCTGSLVYWYALLSILIAPFTANLSKLESQQAAPLPTSQKKSNYMETHWPHRSCTEGK